MKKKLFILLLLLGFMACENESISPLEIPDFKIQQIISRDNNGDIHLTSDFSYNTDGQLISVSNTRTNGTEEWTELTDFFYINQALAGKKFQHLSQGDYFTEDSITYLRNGLLDKIYKFTSYSGQRTYSRIVQFEYNNDGRVKSTTSYDPNSSDTQYSSHFIWANGNITKTTVYNNQDKFYEVFYEYDNGVNYELNNPYFLDSAPALSKNNIIKATYQDFSGLLDLSCNPCYSSYEYNEENLPTKVTYHYAEHEIIYKTNSEN